ncbi:unnamed protein product, partial [Sphacelaria rigidula]
MCERVVNAQVHEKRRNQTLRLPRVVSRVDGDHVHCRMYCGLMEGRVVVHIMRSTFQMCP